MANKTYQIWTLPGMDGTGDTELVSEYDTVEEAFDAVADDVGEDAYFGYDYEIKQVQENDG